jgi:chitodextrinase
MRVRKQHLGDSAYGAPAVSASNAVLGWNASGTPSVVSYRVYYGTSPGTYSQAFGTGLQAGSGTTYTVSNLASDRSYYFAVTAVDSSGNESEYSTEASLLIQ